MNPSPSDQELMTRVAARDRDAFAELYDRFAPQVFGLALHFLNIHGDAEDVLQETFLQVWDQAHRFDPARSPPDGWVLMIARSRAVDRLRQRPAAGPVSDVPDPSASGRTGAEQERREEAGRVSAALETLPEEQRTAIRLAFFGGMTHEQIAGRLGVPLGTVKTRIRLGMLRLRDRLGSRPGNAET